MSDGRGVQARQRAWLSRKNLGELGGSRDGILLLAGALYALGYVVWSVHAWREGLGLLPAPELQYLLAGSLLALMFIASFGLIAALNAPSLLLFTAGRYNAAWLGFMNAVGVAWSAGS